MSQAGPLSTANNPIAPTIPTSFVTDDGTAVPALNVLSVTGGTSTDNNSNGIETDADPNLSKFLHIKLTNRKVGSLTTTDASTTNLISLTLGATPAVYAISGQICGFVPATGDGAAYFFEGVTKTNGVTATDFAGQFTNFQEDTSIQNVQVTATTTGNDFVIEITGIAATTINWIAVINFTLAS
jgi:hypothetical protein